MKEEESRICLECCLEKKDIEFPILWCGKRSYICRKCRKEMGDVWEDYKVE